MATRQEAESAKLAAMRVTMQLVNQLPVSVGEMPMNGGWGLKINLREAPDAGVKLPDHIQGIPTRFDITGSAQLLAKGRKAAGRKKAR